MNDNPDDIKSASTAPELTPNSKMNRAVFAAELAAISGSRQKRGVDDKAEPLKNALEKMNTEHRRKGPTPSIELGILGMAFSGGGIRSSTFCFGALQALNEAGVIKYVDYLSTVSGGGYIGSMWSCFLENSRDKDGKRLSEDPEFKNAPLFKLSHELGEEEAKPFQHLRNYANYLMPRGLVDVIRFPALLLRGLIVNFIMLLPYIILAAAFTAYLFETNIRDGNLAFRGTSDTNHYFPYSINAALGYLVLVILGTVVQSRLRRRGKTSSDWRSVMLKLHTIVLFALVALFIIEYQPLAIHHLFAPGSENGSSNGSSNESIWQSPGEWLASLSAVSGLLTAFFSGFATTRLSAFASKIGLVMVSLLVPISLCMLYFTLVSWAVFPAQNMIAQLSCTDEVLWAYLIAAAAISVVSIYGFDVNATSLHNYYRDSLSRAFLFCIKGDEIEAVDTSQLGSMDIAKSGAPYHLINAVVNNPNLDDVNLRGRRSEFFVFSNLFTGNNRLGYCETAELEKQDPDANLGTAMAVSAAAAAPNMGQKTLNPFITFLMGMLNLRLGYWLPSPSWVSNPIIKKSNRLLLMCLPKVGQVVGPLYFLSELLGLPAFLNRKEANEPYDDSTTTQLSAARRSYINLSDGGHLENLGVFELLRRRCEYIIAIDAEADPNMAFNGLATMIRLARTDMGIDIDIDTEDLRTDEQGLSRRHWAMGKIKYGNNQVGELLYIKSSVTGSENEYITEYRARNPSFPQQSTGDQFFDEEQFEAYRALGFKAARSLFRQTSEQTKPTASHGNQKRVRSSFASADEIFDKLRARNTAALHSEDVFFKLTDYRRQIERRLCEPALLDYASELNFEIANFETTNTGKVRDTDETEISNPTTTPCAPIKQHSVLDTDHQHQQRLYQICNEQMQLMERALVGLRLDDPRNRFRRSNIGWMNLFRRWSRSKTFQYIWATSIANYGNAYKLFCIEEFKLDFGISWGHANLRNLTRAEREFLPDSVKKAMDENNSAIQFEDVLIARLTAVTESSLSGQLKSDQMDQSCAFPVALAVIPKIGGVPVLTHFRIRRTYRSIGLTRQLLEDLQQHSAMSATHEVDRTKQYFKFENTKDEGAKRLERILLHLGYSDYNWET